jgi:subtilisin family serine protease
VHLGAPGAAILTTSRDGAYSSKNGSALATGYVSGAAALILAAEQQSPPSIAALRSRLLACGDPVPSLEASTITGRTAHCRACAC